MLMHLASRSAKSAVHIALALASAWLLLPTAAMAEPGPPCASTPDTIPTGLAVVLHSGEKNYHSMNLQLLKNPFMSGVSVQINWRDIEPVEGKPDWSRLDELFAAAESSKNGCKSPSFPASFLPHGRWKVQRPMSSRSRTGPAMAPSRAFRCLGIASTSTVGSHSSSN